jgi:hypothetical protein
MQVILQLTNSIICIYIMYVYKFMYVCIYMRLRYLNIIIPSYNIQTLIHYKAKFNVYIDFKKLNFTKIETKTNFLS